MIRVRSLIVCSTVACAGPLLIGASAARGASATSASASTSTSGSSAVGPSSALPAATSASATPSPSASASADEPHEITIETLEGSDARDSQFFAAGMEAGGGWIATHGTAGAGQPVAAITATIDIGLGTGGARVPWSLEPFLTFVVGRWVLNSGTKAYTPDHYTSAGARFIWRDPTSFLSHQWLSIGTGVVLTDYGYVKPHRPTATAPGTVQGPTTVTGALLDLGFGVYEWTSRFVRSGLDLHMPIEISSHPGYGIYLSYYLQLSVNK